MGCAAFTPSLVGLASELEGQPFHLIASYNQRGNPEKALHEIFNNGLSVTSGNVTPTLQARHPGVTGITYVPYYLVFDHHGDLVYHHQGGPYHGGDRTAVLDRVRNMLKEVPVVYVGKEEYRTHAKLAAKIASGKALAGNLKKLAAAVAKSPEDAELKRLAAAVERYAMQAVKAFEAQVVKDPKRALDTLGKLAKGYERTPWGNDLVEFAKSAKEMRSKHLAAHKEFAKVQRVWKQLKARPGNGGAVRNPVDRDFRQTNRAVLDPLLAALEALEERYADVPAGKAGAHWLTLLRR